MSASPTLKKFLRLGFIGAGALMVVSAAVNIMSAWQLIDVAEEQSLGITRNEIVATYGVMVFAGLLMIVAGLLWKK